MFCRPCLNWQVEGGLEIGISVAVLLSTQKLASVLCLFLGGYLGLGVHGPRLPGSDGRRVWRRRPRTGGAPGSHFGVSAPGVGEGLPQRGWGWRGWSTC